MRVLKYRKTAKKRNTSRHAINSERVKMRVSKGDTVRVMRGDDRGKEGKVLRIFPKTGRVLVEGVNIVKKHRKARIDADGTKERVGVRSGEPIPRVR